MNKMTCREKILSQDYWDFILPGDRGKMQIIYRRIHTAGSRWILAMRVFR